MPAHVRTGAPAASATGTVKRLVQLMGEGGGELSHVIG